MTAQIIGNIGDNWHQIAGYTKELLSAHATPEKANCARDRQNFWLQAEPNYSDKTYSSGVTDDRLWKYIKTICPRADLAQVFGGNKAIDWHRDGSYAHSTAWILALGRSTFQLETRSGELQSVDLTAGEIIQFNCKCHHRATNVDVTRIGIGIWQAKIAIPDFHQ